MSALACEQPAQARPAQTAESALVNPALVVDSIRTGADALERFQRGLPRVTELGGAPRTRDELVRAVIAALEKGDTAKLSAMHVSRAEYAFLYYPTSVYARKPYELPPDVAWLLSEQNSLKGRARIIRRLGARELELRGYECSPAVSEGENQFWSSCLIDYIDRTTGERATRRLFGPIIERHGSYKLLSYSNDF